MSLAERVYGLSARFPDAEKYELQAQTRRSAVSVPSNIAEGNGRLTRGEKRQFLGQARGSLNELRTQMELAARLGFIDEESWQDFDRYAEAVSRELGGLLNWTRDGRPGR